MLGDNRDNSEDSRLIGLVPRELLIGRAERMLVSADYQGNWMPRTERFGMSLYRRTDLPIACTQAALAAPACPRYALPCAREHGGDAEVSQPAPSFPATIPSFGRSHGAVPMF